MKRASHLAICGLAAAALIPVQSAHASCGSASCPLNTQWESQGAWTKPGVRIDLRAEYLNQDQLRSGSHKVSANAGHHEEAEPEEAEGEHHGAEIHTVNRNWLLDVGYTFSKQWGVAVTLPYLQREHTHAVVKDGVEATEKWDISELGDVRVLGRYQLQDHPTNILFGLKLPTGKFDVDNDEGEKAERSLQPGTGTTDLMLGASHSHGAANSPWSWFVQGLWQKSLNERNDFRNGDQLKLDGGLRYAALPNVGLLAQLNTVARGRDHGDEAEPDVSGGRAVYFTPGISVALNQEIQLYAFVQQPLYQYVHGTQLTADRAYTTGISARF
jgi:hypothetical protein